MGTQIPDCSENIPLDVDGLRQLFDNLVGELKDMIEDPRKELSLYEYEKLCDEFLTKLKYEALRFQMQFYKASPL
jgi:thiaminase